MFTRLAVLIFFVLSVAGCVTTVRTIPGAVMGKKIAVISLMGDEFRHEANYGNEGKMNFPEWHIDDFILGFVNAELNNGGKVKPVAIEYDYAAFMEIYDVSIATEFGETLQGDMSRLLAIGKETTDFRNIDSIKPELFKLAEAAGANILVVFTRNKHIRRVGYGLVESRAGPAVFAFIGIRVFDVPSQAVLAAASSDTADRVDPAIWSGSLETLSASQKGLLRTETEKLIRMDLIAALKRMGLI